MTGAEIYVDGGASQIQDDLAACRAYAEQLADSTGARLVSPGDTPELLTGVGTLYQEILTARPDLDAIVVPVGSGIGAAAATVCTGGNAGPAEIQELSTW
jgi:threonine dehydratase